jgi:hypothetical protein
MSERTPRPEVIDYFLVTYAAGIGELRKTFSDVMIKAFIAGRQFAKYSLGSGAGAVGRRVDCPRV